jgi:hypothetical protein
LLISVLHSAVASDITQKREATQLAAAIFGIATALYSNISQAHNDAHYKNYRKLQAILKNGTLMSY